jgi:hypothetical protein
MQAGRSVNSSDTLKENLSHLELTGTSRFSLFQTHHICLVLFVNAAHHRTGSQSAHAILTPMQCSPHSNALLLSAVLSVMCVTTGRFRAAAMR